jgi:hypothetical protein
MMPFGVDVLGTLSEKLKQLMNEAKDQHSSFTDLTKLYKEDKINEKDFFSKVLNYVVTSSALTFLMARVVLELKSALEKGTTIKDVTGGLLLRLQLPKWVVSELAALYLLAVLYGKSKLCPRFGMRMCHFPRRLRHPRLVKSVGWYFQSRQDSAVSVAKPRKILSNLTYSLCKQPILFTLFTIQK